MGKPLAKLAKVVNEMDEAVEAKTESKPSPHADETVQCVSFFGTHDHAFVAETDIKPYLEAKEDLGDTKGKPAPFTIAVKEVEAATARPIMLLNRVEVHFLVANACSHIFKPTTTGKKLRKSQKSAHLCIKYHIFKSIIRVFEKLIERVKMQLNFKT